MRCLVPGPVLALLALLPAATTPTPAAAQPFIGVMHQRVALLGGPALLAFTGGDPAAVFTMDPELFHQAAAARMPAAGTFQGGDLDGAALHLTTYVDGARRRVETRMAGLPEAFTTVVLVTDAQEVVSLYPAMQRATRLPAEAARLFTARQAPAEDSAAGAPTEMGFERVRGWPATRWQWRAEDLRADLWISPRDDLAPGLQGAAAMSHPLAAPAVAIPARIGQLPAGGALVRILMLIHDDASGPTAVLLELDAVEPGSVDAALFTVPGHYEWISRDEKGTAH